MKDRGCLWWCNIFGYICIAAKPCYAKFMKACNHGACGTCLSQVMTCAAEKSVATEPNYELQYLQNVAWLGGEPEGEVEEQAVVVWVLWNSKYVHTLCSFSSQLAYECQTEVPGDPCSVLLLLGRFNLDWVVSGFSDLALLYFCHSKRDYFCQFSLLMYLCE